MDTKDKGRSAEQCPQDTTCFRYEIHHSSFIDPMKSKAFFHTLTQLLKMAIYREISHNKW